jgi:hypothetical protein
MILCGGAIAGHIAVNSSTSPCVLYSIYITWNLMCVK